MMLMLVWLILGTRKNLQAKDLDNRTRKKMFINLAIIPSLYVISTGFSFLNFDVAVIFPVIMIPSLIVAAKVHRKYKYDTHN
jgi:hypothetical protein